MRIKSSRASFCGLTIRMEAATPLPWSVSGLPRTVMRILLLKCPTTAGCEWSRIMPDLCSRRRTTSTACSGLLNFSSEGTTLPSE